MSIVPFRSRPDPVEGLKPLPLARILDYDAIPLRRALYCEGDALIFDSGRGSCPHCGRTDTVVHLAGWLHRRAS